MLSNSPVNTDRSDPIAPPPDSSPDPVASSSIVSPEDIKDGTLSDYVNINDYEQTLFLFGVESLSNRKVLEKIIGGN